MMALVLLVQNPLALVAQEAPTPPPSPTAPAEPTPLPDATELTPPEPQAPPTEPTPPPQPTAPTAPTAPTSPTAPSYETYVTPTPIPLPTTYSSSSSNQSAGSTASTSGDSGSSTTLSSPTSGAGSQNQNGQAGSTTIATGDATNVGNISTTANNNLTSSPQVSGSGSGAQVVNSGNGTSSTNSGSVGVTSDTNTIQNNSAIVGNDLNQETTTGDNSASMNTGGDNVITTGDANTTGTIVTGVNTNLDAVTVYEFNISDDHLGDYVLDLANATCISGCTPADVTVKNDGNGEGSTNTGDVDIDLTDNTFQTNDALIENNMNLISDTGDNKTSMNTGGDNTITTGDANVSGSVVNMVNTNIVGNVVYAVVNIFGDLVGDIILPDGSILACCVGSVTATNVANGSDSTNTVNIDQSSSTTSSQFNNVDIQNNLVLDATTGENDVNKNTNGASSVTTGDANLVAQVLNVANTNLVGGNWWLVLVNEAGRWIGRIIGADGQNYGGSGGFEFIVSESGEITAVNSGNGADSTNTANVSQSTNTTTSQTNNATIVNNVNLSSNTGGNNANMNTGGNNSIATGDANVIASIVNFVNNNINGGGKLFVTVINVFGSWLGDFVGPGQTKENNDSGNSGGGLGGVGGNASQGDSQESGSAQQSGNSEVSSSSIATSVLGLFINSTGNGSGSISFGNDQESVQAVMGVSDDGQGGNPTAGNKVVRINLAWLTPLIPLGILVLLRKRRKVTKVGASAGTIKAYQ